MVIPASLVLILAYESDVIVEELVVEYVSAVVPEPEVEKI